MVFEKKFTSKRYDYLIVGAGLFGSTFAHEMSKKGKKCLVIDKRNHIGGNLYCENIYGINVHKYGPHIFHTSNKKIWEYINQFAQFHSFVNSPIVHYKNKIYNLPFNMNTFTKLWDDVVTPKDARKKIEEQITKINIENPSNLEEQALSLVGKDIYEIFIKGYTEKQWGRDCKDLPTFIIKRLPIRYTFDNNYFNDIYQGIPVGGYNSIIECMLRDCDIELGVDYIKNREKYNSLAQKIVYTGMIDEYFDYKFGELEYRSLNFEEEFYPEIDNYQGNAVVNYTDIEVPYTRIVEHKFFENRKAPGTIITKEYPVSYKKGKEAYYPINDEKNNSLFEKYKTLAEKEEKVMFGGRLGEYKYYNMDQVIEKALILSKKCK